MKWDGTTPRVNPDAVDRLTAESAEYWERFGDRLDELGGLGAVKKDPRDLDTPNARPYQLRIDYRAPIMDAIRARRGSTAKRGQPVSTQYTLRVSIPATDADTGRPIFGVQRLRRVWAQWERWGGIDGGIEEVRRVLLDHLTIWRGIGYTGQVYRVEREYVTRGKWVRRTVAVFEDQTPGAIHTGPLPVAARVFKRRLSWPSDTLALPGIDHADTATLVTIAQDTSTALDRFADERRKARTAS